MLTYIFLLDDGPNGIPQSDGDEDNIEGDCSLFVILHITLLARLLHANSNFIDHLLQRVEVPWNRGVNIGNGLQRVNRSHCDKLPIIIPEGSIRPLTPIIAAKFATEYNIAVRNHVPVLLHWKEYKKRPALIEAYLGCLRVSSFSKLFESASKYGRNHDMIFISEMVLILWLLLIHSF
jgi:hypothetical protein